ncbi:MAG TPA: hypothetical protein VNA16_00275 [Abditibacteriaceae bacterium]|nr:hypothetical protein [Abditibacteriaceae bacterium]
MQVLHRTRKSISAPGLLWREHAQGRATTLREQGTRHLRQALANDWPALKARRQEFLLSFIKENAAGLLQDARPPVAARVLEEKHYDGFGVQNIVFESVPGWQVGLNLFLPLTAGPHIPIICACGHGPKWQSDHQIPPQILARNGFAAALFDAPMFGEKGSHNDHFIHGSQAAMVGLWSNYFFLIDAIRTADYLEARDDITFARGMGVTGVSGGGFTTLFLCQLDSRVKAIAPVCSVVSLQGHIIAGLYTGCPENYVTGQLRAGLDFDDLLCLAAPTPCLVIGGTQDEMFRPHCVQQSVEKAQTVYAVEGATDKIAVFLDESPHSYTARMATETAAWMRRWLGDDKSVVQIIETQMVPNAALNCGTAATTQGMFDFVQRAVTHSAQSRINDVSNEAIGSLFALPLEMPQCEVESIPAPGDWGYERLGADGSLKMAVLHDATIPIPLLELHSPTAPAGVLVCFSERDKFAALRQSDGFFGLRRRIIAADLRGFGELAPEPSPFDVFGWCGIDRALCDMLLLCGESAVGGQIHDALRVLEWAGAEEAVLYGQGEAALPALFAGLLHPSVRKVVLDSFLCSFEILATAPAPVWLRYAYIPDVLKRFDLPALFQQREDKEFLLLNPCDATKHRLDEAAAARLYGCDIAHVTIQVTDDRRQAVNEWLNP